MIIVRVVYHVKQGLREEVLKQIREKQIEKLLSEQPGNLFFGFAVPANSESDIELLDMWEDEKSFWAHTSCKPNVELFIPIMKEYFEGEEISFFRAEQDEHFLDSLDSPLK